jgi:hypothetical protein
MPLLNQTLCLQPLQCSTSAGAPLVAAPCSSSPSGRACESWLYDTFTYFTFTNTASSLLLTDEGAGVEAAQESSNGSPAQQFVFTPSTMTIQPADNMGLCLTAVPAGGTGSGEEVEGMMLRLRGRAGGQEEEGVR